MQQQQRLECHNINQQHFGKGGGAPPAPPKPPPPEPSKSNAILEADRRKKGEINRAASGRSGTMLTSKAEQSATTPVKKVSLLGGGA